MRRLLVLLFIVLAWPCGARAYTLEDASWPGPTVSVRIQMGPSDQVLIDGSTSWNAVVENAFALWHEQMANLKINWSEAAPGTAARENNGITGVE